jgi:hypothetical protein
MSEHQKVCQMSLELKFLLMEKWTIESIVIKDSLISFRAQRKNKINWRIYSLDQWFSAFFGWRHIFHELFLATHFWDKILRPLYLNHKFARYFLKMISRNNLATHWRKLVTHKRVATPCLRNTAPDICVTLTTASIIIKI